jgi:hypothetical protein
MDGLKFFAYKIMAPIGVIAAVVYLLDTCHR